MNFFIFSLQLRPRAGLHDPGSVRLRGMSGLFVRFLRSLPLLWLSCRVIGLLMLGGPVLAEDRSSPATENTVCARCHLTETQRYLSTAMGKSFTPPDKYPEALVKQQSSGSVIGVSFQNGTMVHKLTEHGFVVEYPIRYQVGGGMEGSSFFIQLHNYLFESPLSWYNAFGWDLSPGYESRNVIEFERPITVECLFCHASGSRFDDPDGRHLNGTPTSIGCERCHGRSEEHVRHPSSTNIVNPSKLAGPARQSICEQCHLEGNTRVLNPGKDWTDFRAGEPAEDVFTTFVLTGEHQGEQIPLASEVEQFAQSRCAQMSKGKLWCGTCHNPHADHRSRAAEIRAICTSCHQKPSPAAHPASLTECTSCHMPTNGKTTIAHASNTDHRILRPGEQPRDSGKMLRLSAWREPQPNFQQRNLGIAELRLPRQDYQGLWSDGGDLLLSLGGRAHDDSDVVFSLTAFYLDSGDLPRALEFARRAVELSPQSAVRALTLARILETSGADDKAEQQFVKAIALNPSWKEPYGRLTMFYVRQKKFEDAIRVLDRYLTWNPNEILFHEWRKQILSQENAGTGSRLPRQPAIPPSR